MTHNPGLRRKIVKAGGSLVVALPSHFAQQLGIEKGDMVEITLTGKQIVIEKTEPE
jgi:antitoxin component of MazEF toxin-antitoxin module